jgi:hypothetical protein
MNGRVHPQRGVVPVRHGGFRVGNVMVATLEPGFESANLLRLEG